MENWVEIDLKRLKSNYEYIKSKTNCPICAVIKADGYGVGSYEIAKELEELGVERFAVAFLKEAIDLRNFGIKSEILVLNYVSPEKIREVEDSGFIFTLYSLEQLTNYSPMNNLEKLRFHVKINSGMNRLGINKEETHEFIRLVKSKNIKIEALYSHFAHIEDEEFTEKQFREFCEITEIFEKEFCRSFLKHISNSGATLKYPNYNLDFVRVGMGLYGLQALEKKDENIKGIITWKSRISAIRDVKKGERISYGKKILDEAKKIAIIPVGYSHGYMRQLNSDAFVLLKGEKVKILGKIFMDQMIIDVTNVEGLKLGDEIVLLGDGVEAEVIARFSDTIADDVISKISPRIERVFIKE